MYYLTSNDWIQIIFWNQNEYLLDKYNLIWEKIKEILSIKFRSKQYIKAKVKAFNGVIKTNFLRDEVSKENKHYTCIAWITRGSVIGMEEKIYP